MTLTNEQIAERLEIHPSVVDNFEEEWQAQNEVFPDFIGVSSYIDKLDSSNAEIKSCQILQKRINKMIKDNEDLPVPMSDEQFNKFLDFYNENLNLKGFTGLFEVVYCSLTEIVIVQPPHLSSAFGDIFFNFFKNKKNQKL